MNDVDLDRENFLLFQDVGEAVGPAIAPDDLYSSPTTLPGSKRLAVASLALVAVTLLAVAWVAHRRDASMSTLGSAPAESTSASGPALGRASDLLRLSLVSLSVGTGFEISPSAFTGTEYVRPDGGRYAEARLQLEPRRGKVLVSILLGNPAAVATTRDGPVLSTIDGAEVYLGTDSSSARAVSALTDDPAQVVYLRSESGADIATLDDLARLAVTLAEQWPDVAATANFDSDLSVSTPLSEDGGCTEPYVVDAGDTIEAIAGRFGIGLSAVKPRSAAPIADGDVVDLVLPVSGGMCTSRPAIAATSTTATTSSTHP